MASKPGSRPAKAARKEALLKLLREIRKEKGIRQVEMAKRLGKPQSFVSKYESGERRLDLLDLEEVCVALGVAVSEFAKRFELADTREDTGGRKLTASGEPKASRGSRPRET